LKLAQKNKSAIQLAG